MIRVNLLQQGVRGSGGTKTGIAAGTMVTDIFSGGRGEGAREGLLKAVLFFTPIIFLFGYQQYTATIAENEYQNLRTRVTKTDAELKKLDPAVKELEKFLEEKKKVDSQLDVVKKLSKERLKNVKSLDAIQNIIPMRAWLSDLKISESRLDLEGFATNDLVISEFMQSLEASIYFKDVLLVNSEESKAADGAVKKFTVKSTLENL